MIFRSGSNDNRSNRRYRRSVRPPPKPLDAAALMAAPLLWATVELPWLRADYNGQPVFMLLNTSFPDGPLYSLLVDDDVTVDLDDLPPRWQRGPLDWPEARGG